MKKIISSILLCFMLFLVGITGVSAATKDVEISEFKLQSKSSTATVENVSLDDNNKVTGTIALNKVDDFVSFNLTIKNNSNDKFKIIKIEDNNKIDNIALVYQYDENFIESGQSSSVTIKLRYDKELSGQSKLSLDDLNIKINFEKENGARQSIVVNPKTGDSIIRFVIIAIVSLLGAFLLVVKRKRKLGMLLLILASIVLPFAALGTRLDISLYPPFVAVKLPFSYNFILLAAASISPTVDTGINPLPAQLFVLSLYKFDVSVLLFFSGSVVLGFIKLFLLIVTVSDQLIPSSDNSKLFVAAISTSNGFTLTVLIPINHA